MAIRMRLGILQPADPNVAGTLDLNVERENQARLEANNSLKRDEKSNVILFPQPSDDPNDPLNWSLWQRDVYLVVLSIVAVIATTSAPLLAADSVQLALFFHRSFQDAADLSAFLLAGVAVGAVVCVPSARIWGKRHVFLLGGVLMTAASAWGGSTHIHRNYKSLLWARVIQGVALAPFETLLNAVVGDLYFVHERAWRMAFVNTALFGGAFATPIFVGMIARHIGWEWSFYFLAIFMGIGTIVLFLFVPETAYRRDEALNIDILKGSGASETSGSPTGSQEFAMKEMQGVTTPAGTAVPRKRDGFGRRLMPFNGRKSDDAFWKLLLRPFPLYLQPSVFWGCLMQGVIIGWTVMVGVILSLIFLGPPLFFTEEKAGKMYTGALVGALVGLVISGAFSELTTKAMIKANGGVYEPEFRILLAIPTLIFTGIGLYAFGITSANTYKYHWLIPDVFLGFIIAGMVMGAVASAQYLLDAHREIDIEIFTNLIIFKNIFSFVLAYKAYTWVFSTGIRHLFTVFASIEVAICCTSLLMYMFGKYDRNFFHKHDILRLCKLR